MWWILSFGLSCGALVMLLTVIAVALYKTRGFTISLGGLRIVDREPKTVAVSSTLPGSKPGLAKADFYDESKA